LRPQDLLFGKSSLFDLALFRYAVARRKRMHFRAFWFRSRNSEIYCCVSSPWVPSQRVFFKFARTPQTERPCNITVSRQKRVGLPKCAYDCSLYRNPQRN